VWYVLFGDFFFSLLELHFVGDWRLRFSTSHAGSAAYPPQVGTRLHRSNAKEILEASVSCALSHMVDSSGYGGLCCLSNASDSARVRPHCDSDGFSAVSDQLTRSVLQCHILTIAMHV
jgi:hypothetical protein